MIYYGCSQPRELWFIDFNHVHVHTCTCIFYTIEAVVLSGLLIILFLSSILSPCSVVLCACDFSCIEY